MEQTLGYLIFGTGWPVLIIGSIWMWQKAGQLPAATKTFLNVALISFYLLGYVCTVYWQGLEWPVGVLPAFVVFLVLFVVAIRAVLAGSKSAYGAPRESGTRRGDA
jgi:hypothetical protein